MLILTRRPAETIYIGEQVTVTVLGVVGNQVRFGIEAPRSITIDRAEIHERKKRSAQSGGNGPPADGNTEAPQEEANGNVADPSESPDIQPDTDPDAQPDVRPGLKLRK